MAKPVLLTVDDDADVLRAIERDLRSKYGAEYRVISSDSPLGALDLLKGLKVRNDGVALLLADQRMPQMDGVGFLQAAREIFPDAKRALLTAYADTSAAISAINQASIDYFFLKPWDPPSEHLYPQLDDLLDDWGASYRPAFHGIRVLGTRWSPRSYELRDFLARSHVPYQWIDVEFSANDPETKRLVEALGEDATELPVVLFPDGAKLLNSVPAEVAQKVGLQTHAETSFYDLAIVGGGPAGLAAAVYGASEGLHTVMVEREAPGGQAGMSSRIENYLGFPAGLSGGDLARRAAGAAVWRGDSCAAVCRQDANRRIVPDHQSGGWQRNLVSCPDDCHRRAMAAVGGSRDRSAARRGCLLWRRSDRSAVVQGRDCLRSRWREFRGPGRNEFFEVCAACRYPGARRFAIGHYVAISD